MRKHDDAHRPLQGRGQRSNRAGVPLNPGGAELVEHVVTPPTVTLDAMEARFLAARLRRLFQHFGTPVPDDGDDARLIGNAAAGIGLLLTGVPVVAPAERIEQLARAYGQACHEAKSKEAMDAALRALLHACGVEVPRG